MKMNITMKIKYLSVLPIIATLILSGASLAHAQSDVFTQNLYYGLQNNSQVTQLQEFLTSQGLYSGPITGNFYFLTLGAVKAFQTQQGISPAAGYFGPITMAAANKIADAEVSASNNEAITETGTSTPSVTPASTTPQLQLQALLQEVALLEQQLQTQQSSTQDIQNLQTQMQQQTQTLQQIASNTQPQATTPTPTVSITANGSTGSITVPSDATVVIDWNSTNANACNIYPSSLGWAGTAGSETLGPINTSPTGGFSGTYTVSCTGLGGSASAYVTVNANGSALATTTVATSTTTPATAGTCQLSVQNVVENYNNFQGIMDVSKSGGTEDGVSLYATAPNGNGYLSNSTKWIEVMNPVVNIPQAEAFNYPMGNIVPYNRQNTTTTESVWFKASYPDGTVCYDPNEQATIPAIVPLIVNTISATESQQNTSYTITAGSTNQPIGSYSFTASSNEGVNINTVSIELTPGATSPAFQNLKLLVNGTQFGTTQSTVNGNATYSFSGSAFNVPAGQTVNITVYADPLSNASGTYTPATALVGYTGTGAISYSSVTNTAGTINGQAVTITPAGQ